MHPHTAVRETPPFSLSSSPLSSLSFRKASWKTKHATVAGWEHSISTDMHRSKHSNPLLHVLRINIIFIHKHSRKTAVVLLRTHTHARTHTHTHGLAWANLPLSVMRAGSSTRVPVFFPWWHDLWVADWFGPARAREGESERVRERENNQIKEEEEVTGRISKGRGGGERESASTLTWWI